jgi:hypothetical protein
LLCSHLDLLWRPSHFYWRSSKSTIISGNICNFVSACS